MRDSSDGDSMWLKNTQETTAAVEASAAETSAVDTTKPDLSNVDPKMAEGRELLRRTRVLRACSCRDL